MKLRKLQAFEGSVLNVVIETPKGSQCKFDFDKTLQTFRLNKTLPAGMTFPFDYGFVPGTRGGDGDPLDVVVLCDQPLFPGCVVPCRLLGVIEARQRSKGKRAERNDRLVAVSALSVMYADIKSVSDLNKDLVAEIGRFFEEYDRHEGKKFDVVKWRDATGARKLVKSHRT